MSEHLKPNDEIGKSPDKNTGFSTQRAGNLLRFRLSQVDVWVKQGSNANSNKKGKLRWLKRMMVLRRLCLRLLIS